MKYPCGIIQDILPLYQDGVCSGESRKAIEEHLQECPSCKAIFNTLHESEKTVADNYNAEQERRKAASFQSIKKKLVKKQVLAAAAAVALLAAVVLAGIGVLKNTREVVAYQNTISVSMTDGALVGRLYGSMASYVKIKRVTQTINGQEENALFFCVSDTKWDALTTNPEMLSEYTLCPADKGADQIHAVYYYTGDYTGIESMSSGELQKILDASTLVWHQ